MKRRRYMRYAVRAMNGEGGFQSEWFGSFVIRRERGGHVFYNALRTGELHREMRMEPKYLSKVLLATPLSHRLWFAQGVTAR